MQWRSFSFDGDNDITDVLRGMFFSFEMLWARSLSRWVDAEKKYGIYHTRLSAIFDRKLALAIRAMRAWPRYTYHEEDVKLRSSKWAERYKDKRVVMWVNTNVDMQGKPSDSDLQRLTFSLYYGCNVAKGGVFLQLCGWLGGWDLWLGAVSDSDYLEKSGLLSYQEEFQKDDPSSDISFTNILDKGYRCVLAAWRTGGQLLLQPFFAKSDRKFNSREVLLSGAIASDRSANERAVNRMKESGINQGHPRMHLYSSIGSTGESTAVEVHPWMSQKQDLVRSADVWLAWGFQCNFMFKPVL